MTEVLEQITLDINGEQIVIDRSFTDFSDFTPEEISVVAATVGPKLMDKNEEPTVGAVAVMMAIKAARGRSWDKETLTEVITLLTAWLTDELEPVEEVT